MKPNVATCESSKPTTQPRARQMSGLYALKPWFTSRLTPIVNVAVARRVSPDVFTVAGVVAAGAAAVAIALGCWPLAVLFLVLRLAGANLDGAVARAAGSAGRGDSLSTKSATAPRICWPSPGWRCGRRGKVAKGCIGCPGP
jgi:hypothetical protein